jgi:uncharacterized OsmC-like protein/pimeloyl-ACP methyl ester carboxylesterase
MDDRRRITFTGSGGEQLAGRLELPPAGTPRATALFAHCFTCGKDSVAAARISRALTDEGFAVLRFDFTGLGDSGGDFANATFSSNVDDLVRAADHLRATVGAPRLLIGHSLGGAAVLAAAEQIPEASAVVTIGAPADPAHVADLFADDRAEIEGQGEAEVRIAGRPFRVRREFLADIAEQPQRERIGRLDRALLILHAPLDETVGIDNARVIYDAARHPKSFVSLDGADHLLTRRDDADYAAGVIGAWTRRYLPQPSAPDADAPDPDAPTADAGTVLVREGDAGPYLQQVAMGHHRLVADEPESVGGGDRGPTPYDLLLASLGACTSMTLRMYADRKEWPLTGVDVTLRHRRIHAKDCAECETETGMLDRLERVVTIEGDDLTDEQRAQLLVIADKCPVHRTLTSEVVIETRSAP